MFLTVPLLAAVFVAVAMFAGRVANVVVLSVPFVLMAWSLITQHPLVPYIRRGRRRLSWPLRAIVAVGRHPIGAMLLAMVVVSVPVGIRYFSWHSRERADWVAAYLTISLVGGGAGLNWWEIFVGSRARKRRRNSSPRVRARIESRSAR